jgi:serine/threonine protein kinase
MCLSFCCKIKTQNSKNKDNESDSDSDDEEDPFKKFLKYNFLETIGHGATSVIRVVKKNNNDKKLVAKIVERQSLNKALREIHVLKKLKRKKTDNFYPIFFDSFLLNMKTYIIMDYCYSILNMTQSIIELHSRGFVHLDIKLENFILTDKKQIKLIDFGTAHKITDRERKLETITGTRGYSAPEIYRNSYHRNSDVWALGICIWILIVRTYCFHHKNLNHTYKFNNFPEQEFYFPNKKQVELMNKYNLSLPIRKLFIEIFKIFPLDRCSLEYIYYFDFEKNYDFVLTEGEK